MATALSRLQSSTHTPITLTTWICFAIFIAAIGLFLFVTIRRRLRFRAGMKALGLKKLGGQLPPSFPPPTDIWHIQPRIADCYFGVYNHYDVTTFRAIITEGRQITTRTIVAARRTDWQARSTYIKNQQMQVDTTSVPGWTVVSRQARYPDPANVEALFKMLTAGPEA